MESSCAPRSPYGTLLACSDVSRLTFLVENQLGD